MPAYSRLIVALRICCSFMVCAVALEGTVQVAGPFVIAQALRKAAYETIAVKRNKLVVVIETPGEYWARNALPMNVSSPQQRQSNFGPKANFRYNRAMHTNISISPHKKVAVIAFEGITPFHLSVPCLVFGSTVVGADAMSFEVIVCALQSGLLSTSAGFSISATFDLSVLDAADIIVMPSWHEDRRSAPDILLYSLCRAHARGATVVGLCLGAFPLAQAGLLDGRTVATHWEAAAILAERYPRL